MKETILIAVVRVRRYSRRVMKLWCCFLSFAVILLLGSLLQKAYAGSILEGGHDLVQLDPQHTHVDFLLLGNLHGTRGRFILPSGTIAIDPHNGNASGQIVLDARSEDSSERLRDDIMKNAILEVRRYREITFMPQRAEGDRDSKGDFYGTISGLMQLHGYVHEVGTEFHGHLDVELIARCTFLIPYVDWGVESPNVLTLTQIINSTIGDNSTGTRMFAAFAYMLPVLRKIPPNLFNVSDMVEVTVAATGRITWPPEAQAPDDADRGPGLMLRCDSH
jgi:polyisoprenoid-binding protein YceI